MKTVITSISLNLVTVVIFILHKTYLKDLIFQKKKKIDGHEIIN